MVDGDTVIVDVGGRRLRVRYIGIDAPESVIPETTPEPWGIAAGAANADLVGGSDVVLERDVSETDQYGRLLRHVWLAPGDGGTWTLVSVALVRRGLANAVTFPPDVKYTDELRSAERAARGDGLGMWGPPE